MKKSISALIAEVLAETVHEEVDGKMENMTWEKAIIRTAAKRAMDPRNRLGMEATRFLTEYQYGKPVQPVGFDKRHEFGEYEDLTVEQLQEIEDNLLKGAMGAHAEITPKDPGRYVEEKRRVEAVQTVLVARGEDIFERNERATEAAREARAKDKETPCGESNPTGTDDLCAVERELIEAPWF